MEQASLGEVLIHMGLLTKPQLTECLAIQAERADGTPLGEILVSNGCIDGKTLQTILSIQRKELDRRRTRDTEAAQLIRDRLDGAPIAEYLAVARELEASDIYVSSGISPTVRVHGTLRSLAVPPLDLDQAQSLIFSLLSKDQIDVLTKQKSVDFAVGVNGVGRFRASVFRHNGGIACVLRAVPETAPRLEDLGLPAVVRDFVRFRHGLVLVTGPSGSGKTTTLAALVDEINRTEPRHIITLENPVEVVFENRRSLVTQREIRTHTDSYGQALTAALREDPDVIVVAELKDAETVHTALSAAKTGHLVFGTMHTRNALGTILRLVDQFPSDKHFFARSLIASTLRAVISQDLVPRADGAGRAPACEVLIVNPAVANLIREGRMWQVPMVMQTSAQGGMVLMDDDLEALARDGVISMEEARVRATDPKRFLTPA